jgi:hypothetical protein
MFVYIENKHTDLADYNKQGYQGIDALAYQGIEVHPYQGIEAHRGIEAHLLGN